MEIQEILNSESFKLNVLQILNDLKEGKLTGQQFHNKKAYCKRKGYTDKVLAHSCAWEYYNNEVRK